MNRCKSCGTKHPMPHLKNCKDHGYTSAIRQTDAPSRAQLDYAHSLIGQLGYDIESYDFSVMTSNQCSKLIDELVKELG